jgi:pyruvate/2-oxoglutarate dehydrogenase complex dihydrolipoamide acyltransferase (E2) component
MATKKSAAPAAKKTAPPASKSRSVVPWQEKLAEAARRAAAAEKPVGLNKGIGTRGGIMVIDDVPVKGNSIDAVILVVALENQYFDGPFDPNHPQ